ncbi:putative signal transducing protein [Hanstruepera marina]|uniref:putative signal transducing protein n=1 Tax=Hanstruepera marina TaxID=2873265 RepID=UPI001CA5FCAC|nr:DUF2007 domain-containing protein [Hanstruepera marina]
MDSEYKKVFTGSFIVAQLIVDKLKAVDITAIIKDETESGRLAGFGSSVPGYQDVYVHQDELENAMPIVNDVTSELEN